MIVSSLAALLAGGALCVQEVLSHKRKKEIKLLLEEIHVFVERAEEDAKRIVGDAMEQAENIVLAARQQEEQLQKSMKSIKSSIHALKIEESAYRARIDASKKELDRTDNTGAALKRYREAYHLGVVISKDIERVKTRMGHIMSMHQSKGNAKRYEALVEKAGKLLAAESHNSEHIEKNRAMAISAGVSEGRLLEIENEIVNQLVATKEDND